MSQVIVFLLIFRDLCPNNIIIEEGSNEVKIIDFNVSKRFIDRSTGKKFKMMTSTGFEKYRAPELVLASGAYTENIDIWSAGACLYFMISGEHAFDG